MRISDWSSDVCSSDLVDQADQRIAEFQPERGAVADLVPADDVRRRRRLGRFRGLVGGRLRAPQLPGDEACYARGGQDHEVRHARQDAKKGEDGGDRGPGPARSELTGDLPDRKRVVSGKSGSTRVDLGGRRII